MAGMAEMAEKIYPVEDIVEEIASHGVGNTTNIFQKLKRQLTFTLKRTHSAFFDERHKSIDLNTSSEEVEVRMISNKGQDGRSQLRKGRSEEGQGSYHSPLERCIISREKRLRRKMSFDNYSAYLNKTT